MTSVDRFAERLEAEFCSRDAARGVETLSEVGRVVVAFDENATSAEDFVESVESGQEKFGVRGKPLAADAVSQQADAEPIIRGTVETAVNAESKAITRITASACGRNRLVAAISTSMADHMP